MHHGNLCLLKKDILINPVFDVIYVVLDNMSKDRGIIVLASARHGPCTARKYPVVVTITIGFTKGRPLCIEYDRRWKTKLLLFSMKI